MSWRLERTLQCAHCPWRVSTNPSTDIPNGYDAEKHKKLVNTIAPEDPVMGLIQAFKSDTLHMMACHDDHEQPCIGWLWHQLGRGNNIALRMKMRSCENMDEVQVVGPQHERFEDTIK